jgi:signal transduction histidine kinase
VVRVHARLDGAVLLIDVADAGPGFPEDFLPHAFERFRRSDLARDRCHGGAGLGLAIVKAIAEAHSGWVRASNDPAGGARVQLALRQPGPA